MRTLSRMLVVLGVLLGLARSAQAGPILDGQTLQMTYRFGQISDIIATNVAVVGPAIEWEAYLGIVSVDASDTNVRFTFHATGAWANTTFSGFGIFDLNGTIPDFAAVTLNSTNMAGFGQSNITFDADRFFVNWQGLAFTPQTFVSIDVSSAAGLPATVPEPATLAMLGAGLVMIAGIARSRRRRRT